MDTWTKRLRFVFLARDLRICTEPVFARSPRLSHKMTLLFSGPRQSLRRTVAESSLGNQKLFYIMYILSDKVNPIIYHTILHVVLKDFSGVADLDPFCCKANPLLYQQQDNKSLGSRFHCAHLSSRIQR